MRLVRALVVGLVLGPLACINPGEPYEGGGSGGGGSLVVPGDAGDGGEPDGAALGGGADGTVRGETLAWCDLLTYACPTGTTCALYGAVDPAYSNLVCGPADLCSIVTCRSPKRCVVGAGGPPSVACR